LQRVAQAPFPIAAFAQGPAIGAGADLFCACALRWGVRSARFRFPGWGFELALGTRRLARIVGETRARSILFESRWIDADEAMTANLLHAIVEPGRETHMLIDAARRGQHLSAAARASILALTRQDTDDADLAALVRSAAQPGLRERMLAYRRAAAAR
jgi:enoyl-CoA hydratase